MDKQQYYDKNGVSLIDYINVIIKHKRVLLISIVIGISTPLVFIYFQPKTYETSATVRIGNITQPLLTKSEASYELSGSKILASVIKKLALNLSPNRLKKMIRIENINDAELIRIKVINSDPQLAAKVCNLIAETFVTENKALFFEKYRYITKEVDELKQNIPANIEKIFYIKKELITANDFEVFEPAAIPSFSRQYEDGFGMVMYIANILILSILTGIFIAFFLEYRENDEK